MADSSFRIRESSWLARLAAWKLGVPNVAITLGRTIHLHGTDRLALLSDPCWLRHELKHVEQFRRYGFLRFIGLYLAESIRVGYYNNRFEREARAAVLDASFDPVVTPDLCGGGQINPPDGGIAIPAVQRQNA
jgi:hypothetical protein